MVAVVGRPALHVPRLQLPGAAKVQTHKGGGDPPGKYGGQGSMTADPIPMRYRDLVPNFNRADGFVEIPTDYERMPLGRPASDGHPEAQQISREAHKRLTRLIRRCGIAPVYFDGGAEGIDAPRANTLGCRVPVDDWDIMMGDEIPRWYWVPK